MVCQLLEIRGFPEPSSQIIGASCRFVIFAIGRSAERGFNTRFDFATISQQHPLDTAAKTINIACSYRDRTTDCRFLDDCEPNPS